MRIDISLQYEGVRQLRGTNEEVEHDPDILKRVMFYTMSLVWSGTTLGPGKTALSETAKIWREVSESYSKLQLQMPPDLTRDKGTAADDLTVNEKLWVLIDLKSGIELDDIKSFYRKGFYNENHPVTLERELDFATSIRYSADRAPSEDGYADKVISNILKLEDIINNDFEKKFFKQSPRKISQDTDVDLKESPENLVLAQKLKMLSGMYTLPTYQGMSENQTKELLIAGYINRYYDYLEETPIDKQKERLEQAANMTSENLTDNPSDDLSSQLPHSPLQDANLRKGYDTAFVTEPVTESVIEPVTEPITGKEARGSKSAMQNLSSNLTSITSSPRKLDKNNNQLSNSNQTLPDGTPKKNNLTDDRTPVDKNDLTDRTSKNNLRQTMERFQTDGEPTGRGE